MDVRNHGDSPHGPLSLAGIADDISAVVREVGVGRRVVVVGHSMGGAATQFEVKLIHILLQLPLMVSWILVLVHARRFFLR